MIYCRWKNQLEKNKPTFCEKHSLFKTKPLVRSAAASRWAASPSKTF